MSHHCPDCSREFAKQQSVAAHMRFCKGAAAAQAPPANVAPAAMAPQPATPSTPPPLPTPPTVSEVPQYVARMPMPPEGDGYAGQALRIDPPPVEQPDQPTAEQLRASAERMVEQASAEVEEVGATGGATAATAESNSTGVERGDGKQLRAVDILPGGILIVEVLIMAIDRWFPNDPVTPPERKLLMRASERPLPDWAALPMVLVVVMAPRVIMHPRIWPIIQGWMDRDKEEPEELATAETKGNEAAMEAESDWRMAAAAAGWRAPGRDPKPHAGSPPTNKPTPADVAAQWDALEAAEVQT